MWIRTVQRQVLPVCSFCNSEEILLLLEQLPVPRRVHPGVQLLWIQAVENRTALSITLSSNRKQLTLSPVLVQSIYTESCCWLLHEVFLRGKKKRREK